MNRSRNTPRCASAARRSFGSSRGTKRRLRELIRFCRRENLPLFVIGRGSNLLVRDGGIRGVVVHPCGGEFDRIEVSGNEITAGVGAKLKEVAYAGKAAGLGGFDGWREFRARSAAACA